MKQIFPISEAPHFSLKGRLICQYQSIFQLKDAIKNLPVESYLLWLNNFHF